MRKRRAEAFADKYGTKTIGEILEESIFGGKDGGKVTPRQMPIVSSYKGIKMEWDNRTDEYPTTVTLQMSDGNWVKYRIEIEQPGFTRAMDIIKNPAHERGYPPKRP